MGELGNPYAVNHQGETMKSRSSEHERNQPTRREWLTLVAGGVASATLTRLGYSQAVANRVVLAPRDVTKDLLVHQRVPHNAEGRLPDLVTDWVTPIEHFYVRSHAPVPDVDVETFRVRVEGMVENELTLSIDELVERFEPVETVATLTCAGNRRAEYNAIKEVGGVQWRAGAIGNAKWQGVSLADVLNRAGVKEAAKHVWFESVDQIEKSGKVIPFGASIPLEKAMADDDGTPGGMLATHMNGRPLPADHGFPVRSIVPGYIGARSVKWLGRIVVSDRPSPNHYVSKAYKLVTEDTPLAWIEAGPLYRYVLNSAISPSPMGGSIPQGTLSMQGFALPPGNGRTVAKVEVSADDGKSWSTAKITSENRPYCWVLWRANVKAVSPKSLLVRATDSTGLTQPEVVPWNLKGYMQNGWYRLPMR